MKKQDTPQDQTSRQTPEMTEMLYVTDENHDYTTVNSTGWEAKKAALDESLELIGERIEDARQNVANNISSPIVYFMELNKMDFQVLAAYVRKWQWIVKRHGKPKIFKKLKDSTLKKYADTFGITVDELKNFDGK